MIHDEQSAMTAGGLSSLQQVLADAAASSPAGADKATALPCHGLTLAGLVIVDFRDDPRVQVADLLVGMAPRLPEIVDGALQPFLPPPQCAISSDEARSVLTAEAHFRPADLLAALPSAR